jgi:hypothetical protein
MADQLTPVLAYRCLVKEDDREAPSFLFESVVNGTQQVRGYGKTSAALLGLMGGFAGAPPLFGSVDNSTQQAQHD